MKTATPEQRIAHLTDELRKADEESRRLVNENAELRKRLEEVQPVQVSIETQKSGGTTRYRFVSPHDQSGRWYARIENAERSWNLRHPEAPVAPLPC